MGRRAPASIAGHCPGDWDTVLDRKCFWGARYEDAKMLPSGMVQLENYQFLTALRDHFLDNKDWQETQWYRWVSENGPSRYNTKEKTNARLRFLDQLYEDCISGKYSQNYNNDDLPLINIGRGGRISIEDGRHRICVAKVAGIESIPVKINAVHAEFE
jgi:hypothetical protein